VSIKKQHTCLQRVIPKFLPPLGIYIEGEARQATYRLNCSGEFTRARFGHSEVFEKMTDEWPFLLALGDKIVPITAFGRGFLVELPPKRSETLEILPSDGVIFGYLRYKGILSTWLTCNTVFQTEVYIQFSPVLTTVGA
jgi:hypothetical protein